MSYKDTKMLHEDNYYDEERVPPRSENMMSSPKSELFDENALLSEMSMLNMDCAENKEPDISKMAISPLAETGATYTVVDNKREEHLEHEIKLNDIDTQAEEKAIEQMQNASEFDVNENNFQEFQEQFESVEAEKTNSGSESEETDTESDSDARSEYSDVRSQYSNFGSEYSDVSSEHSDVRSQYSDAGSEYSDVRSQYSNFGSEYSDIGSEYSDVRSQYSDSSVDLYYSNETDSAYDTNSDYTYDNDSYSNDDSLDSYSSSSTSDSDSDDENENENEDDDFIAEIPPEENEVNLVNNLNELMMILVQFQGMPQLNFGDDSSTELRVKFIPVSPNVAKVELVRVPIDLENSVDNSSAELGDNFMPVSPNVAKDEFVRVPIDLENSIDNSSSELGDNFMPVSSNVAEDELVRVPIDLENPIDSSLSELRVKFIPVSPNVAEVELVRIPIDLENIRKPTVPLKTGLINSVEEMNISPTCRANFNVSKCGEDEVTMVPISEDVDKVENKRCPIHFKRIKSAISPTQKMFTLGEVLNLSPARPADGIKFKNNSVDINAKNNRSVGSLEKESTNKENLSCEDFKETTMTNTEHCPQTDLKPSNFEGPKSD